MATKIEWCEETWSLITGCSPVSEGCEHCYARRMSCRLKGRYGYPKDDPFKVTFHPDRLEQPFKWKKPRMIFVCSMGDLFHKNVRFESIFSIWGIMAKAHWHTFLILTKRPAIMKDRLGWIRYFGRLPNVWLGVTGENQQRADERIPILLQIPAAKHFVSIEPMLGPVNLDGYLADHEWEYGVPGGLNWVIAGGESGPGARPMKAEWARSIRDQCKEANIPFFMKQMAKREKIPEDLIIREFPND